MELIANLFNYSISDLSSLKQYPLSDSIAFSTNPIFNLLRVSQFFFYNTIVGGIRFLGDSDAGGDGLIIIRLFFVIIIIFSFAAIQHFRKKIGLFYDRSDALLTIFSPIFSFLPVIIIRIIGFLFNLKGEWFSIFTFDVGFLTILFLLFCSLRYARLTNPYSIYGFCLSCFGRIFSIFFILILGFTFLAACLPKDDQNMRIWERDYYWARNFGILASLYSALAFAVSTITIRKVWGDPKDWFLLR